MIVSKNFMYHWSCLSTHCSSVYKWWVAHILDKHFYSCRTETQARLLVQSQTNTNLSKTTARNGRRTLRKWDTHLIRSLQRSDQRCEHSAAPNWSLNSAQQVKCKGDEDKKC